MQPKVRVTAILIQEQSILLLKQDITESSARKWSLPGGTLEWGESIEGCLVREMQEETGLDVQIGDLLYVCDRIQDGRHVVHMTFEVKSVGGQLTLGVEPEATANPIQAIEMVPISDLEEYGFTPEFRELAVSGFPDKGQYGGSVQNIGL